MSRFLTEKDYDASVHREIIDTVTREDAALVKICEDRAIKDLRNYLFQRYDCDAIFKATGCKRDAMLVMFCVDITLYHLFGMHNPRNMPPMRKDRYDRAIEWLKAVGRGNLAAEGLPEVEGEGETIEYQITGERMRPTRR
jgi:phage gp36-like protein